jgi:hypothetical protein
MECQQLSVPFPHASQVFEESALLSLLPVKRLEAPLLRCCRIMPRIGSRVPDVWKVRLSKKD